MVNLLLEQQVDAREE